MSGATCGFFASAGLQALDSYLALLLQDKASADAPAQSNHQHNLHACLALRLMLLETRQQLHLLCSNFAAARADAFDSMRVLNQFPRLLSGLRPVVHIQAGLYAQAVGCFDSAAQHFMAAANEAHAQGSALLAADARHLAAMCYVSQNTAESGRRNMVGRKCAAHRNIEAVCVWIKHSQCCCSKQAPLHCSARPVVWSTATCAAGPS